ncbi:MAG: glycosyltransferase family 1 protein [Akkermansiaceae bacterium]|nr:glycosyltransferase family 1 protein [Akkermansiaceae bacterium]
MKILAINYSLSGGDLPVEETHISTRRKAFVQRAADDAPAGRESIPGAYLRLLRHALAADFEVMVLLANGHGGMEGKGARLRKVSWLLQSVLTEWLVRIALRSRSKVLVVVDLGDDRTIARRDAWFLRRCALYFKRELAADVMNSLQLVVPWWTHIGLACFTPRVQDWARKLRPIPLGIPGPPPDPAGRQKKHDIFYCGTNRTMHFIRLEVEKVLERLEKDHGVKVCFPKERIPRKEFAEAIADSWISISPSGVGWDCFRHYEVAAGGAALLLSVPTIRWHRPLRDGKHCLYFLDGEDLEERILELLPDKERIAKLSAAGREHVLRWHTFGAIRKYIFGEIESCLAARNAGGKERDLG